jgi:hypothetical protein
MSTYRCYYQIHHSLFLPISLYDFLCIWKSDSRSRRCDPKLRALYTQAAPDCRLCTYVGLTATHTWQMSARAHKHVIVVSSSIEYICTHRNRCSTFNWRVIRSRVTNMKLGYGVSYMYALSNRWTNFHSRFVYAHQNNIERPALQVTII